MTSNPKRDSRRVPGSVPSGGESAKRSDRPVAVVTRAAGRIECASAMRLARGGMSIIVCDDVESTQLLEIERELKSAGLLAVAMVADVTCETDANRVVDQALATFGRIDVLVNGRASGDRDLSPESSAEDLASDIGSGINSPLLVTRAVIPHMIAGEGGRIVNIVSSSGRYRSAYFRQTTNDSSDLRSAGIDGALLGLTRELAFELAPHRIRVNAATIGWIRTPDSEHAWQQLSTQEQSFLLEEISLCRLGEPDEAAAVVEFLASDASSYVTGTAIDVNGGWWMS
jgi:3-oxoacyl-[acyl-carrier protein] reductase